MAEATWEGTEGSVINWRMSASLENVSRGGSDVAEVASLEQAVRDWLALDPPHRAIATLTTEHAVPIDGAGVNSFFGEAIATLASRLPGTGGSK